MRTAQSKPDVHEAVAPRRASESSGKSTLEPAIGNAAQGSPLQASGTLRPDLMTASHTAAREIMQMKEGGGGTPQVPTPRGAGAPLGDGVRGPMEKSFGTDFRNVRVHQGPSAESMGGVRAATRGSNITFAAGQYQPSSGAGRELIGHELTHVVQQASGRVQPTAQHKGGPVNTDPGLEAEADRMGARAAAGQRVSMSGARSMPARQGGVAQFDLVDWIKDKIDDRKKAKAQKKQDKLDKEQEDQRLTDRNKLKIEAARDADTGVKAIVAAAVTTLQTDLQAHIAGVLGAKKSLVAELKKVGSEEIKSKLGVTNRARKDSGEQSDEVMETSKVHELVITSKSKQLAKDGAKAEAQTLTDAVTTAFDESVGPNPSRTQAVTEAKLKAQEAADKARGKITSRLKKELEKSLTKDKNDVIKTSLINRVKGHAKLDEAAKDELDARKAQGGDVDLVIDQPVTDGVTKLKERATAFLEDKLGANGVSLLRSEKLKAFHGKMLEVGETKAQKDSRRYTKNERSELREDAKKRAAKGAEASMHKALKEFAKEGAKQALRTAGVKDTLRQAASSAAWALIRKGEAGDDAAKGAVKTALPELETKVTEAARTWKNEYVKANDQAKLDEVGGKVETKVQTDRVGKKGAQKSESFKADVDAIAIAVAKDGYEPVREDVASYLTGEIGAKGAGWWRSQPVKDFRAAMKEAGREQAYGDVDIAIGSDTSSGEATKKYMKIAGRDEAYGKAKGSVNRQMKQFARKGARHALKEAKTIVSLRSVARTAAFKSFRGSDDKATAEERARAAVLAAVAAEITKARAEADTWKTTLFSLSGTETDDVKQRVETEQVGQKSYKAALEANTTAKGMNAVGRIVDLAVPNRGDAAKVEVEVRIPVPTAPGVFVVLRVVAEAERGVTTRKNDAPPGGVDSKSLKVGAQINIGGGADLWGIKLDGTVGFFVRAQAMDTKRTFELLNYGAYRFVSGINNSMADWWGGSNKTRRGPGGHGKTATERAELWAAMIEERNFLKKKPGGGTGKKVDEEAFVDIGMALGGKAKFKTGIVEGEGSLRGEVFKRYDGMALKQSLKRARRSKGGATPKLTNNNIGIGKGGDTLQDAKDRRKYFKGKTHVGGIAETKIGVEIAGKKFEFAAKLEVGTAGFNCEIAAGLKLDTTGPAGSFEKIVDGICSSAASALRSVIGIYQNTKQTPGEQGTKVAGSLVDMANDAESIVDVATGGKLMTALGEIHQVKTLKSDSIAPPLPGGTPAPTKKAGAGSEVMLQLVFQFGPGNCNLQIKQIKVKKISVDFGGVGGGLEGSIEKQKKLAQLGLVNNKMHVELLGFGSTNKK